MSPHTTLTTHAYAEARADRHNYPSPGTGLALAEAFGPEPDAHFLGR